MESETIQFAISLAAVSALVLLAHRLGFSRGHPLSSEEEARELLGHLPFGFHPVSIALDSEGEGAIARDGHGRLALLVRHGGRFVARPVNCSASLVAEDGVLRIHGAAPGLPTVALRLGDSARDWADTAPGAI